MIKRYIDIALYRQVADALKTPFRYERNDRFVLNEVQLAFREHRPAEGLYIDAARDALAKHYQPGHDAESVNSYGQVA